MLLQVLYFYAGFSMHYTRDSPQEVGFFSQMDGYDDIMVFEDDDGDPATWQ